MIFILLAEAFVAFEFIIFKSGFSILNYELEIRYENFQTIFWWDWPLHCDVYFFDEFSRKIYSALQRPFPYIPKLAKYVIEYLL